MLLSQEIMQIWSEQYVHTLIGKRTIPEILRWIEILVFAIDGRTNETKEGECFAHHLIPLLKGEPKLLLVVDWMHGMLIQNSVFNKSSTPQGVCTRGPMRWLLKEQPAEQNKNTDGWALTRVYWSIL